MRSGSYCAFSEKVFAYTARTCMNLANCSVSESVIIIVHRLMDSEQGPQAP